MLKKLPSAGCKQNGDNPHGDEGLHGTTETERRLAEIEAAVVRDAEQFRPRLVA